MFARSLQLQQQQQTKTRLNSNYPSCSPHQSLLSRLSRLHWPHFRHLFKSFVMPVIVIVGVSVSVGLTSETAPKAALSLSIHLLLLFNEMNFVRAGPANEFRDFAILRKKRAEKEASERVCDNNLRVDSNGAAALTIVVALCVCCSLG